MKPSLRDMRFSDIPEVVKHDREILGHSLGEETLTSELEENPFAHYYLLEDEDTKAFLGMISMWIDTPTAQILNVYVLPEYRRQGFGKQLMNFMMQLVKSYEVNEITLEVRPSNLKAISMYQSFGFEPVAIRHGYYENGEDAYLMYKRM
ncbi:MAG: ribosomal protein S18-alanine N-acetyltransferase [Candidatus Izemoplasmatales bacterium]|nr:ribosomal protein S18-alanine N-acetyltransferase [Candidatus Izemoplasmatales bacterium]